ncbi:MAG: prepilin-type N-terminal cleavage/methylation domain-containing protein [Burkholderiaceae bacterium]|nr:prepilin-type N-terminal cleavage/methylation domain-containing protein [Burkholderiaceae bacterium]
MRARASRAPHLVRRALPGFTLLELLVTMALLSLLMLGMASALRTMAQTEQRVDARLASADEFRVATGFLRSIVGQVSARKNPMPLTQGASPYLFVGAPTALSWVGVMPARYGAGGRNFFHLAVEPVQGEPALVIRFLPWTDSPQFPDWEQAESRVLVRGVASFALTYEDVRQTEPLWVNAWERTDSLPDRVRIELHTDTGPWPMWVAAMRSLPASERGGSGRFSAGPE